MTNSSYAANQSKTEPHPPGAGDGQTETPSGDDPQAPSPGTGDQTGLGSREAAPGTSEELPPVQGLHVPDVPQEDPRT